MPDLPTFPLTAEGIRDALRTLDAQPWELAKQLGAAGVKGVIGNECACPIARRIAQLVPGADVVFVEAETVRVGGYDRDTFGFDLPVTYSAQLPDGVQDFIQEFDLSEWPELIEGVTPHA
jgi:hypothetical protein